MVHIRCRWACYNYIPMVISLHICILKIIKNIFLLFIFFSHGSDYVAQQFALIAKGPAFGVTGGGETITLLDKLKIKNWPDFVSTAGGAMLEFLEGKTLPGIRPLLK